MKVPPWNTTMVIVARTCPPTYFRHSATISEPTPTNGLTDHEESFIIPGGTMASDIIYISSRATGNWE